MAVPLVLGAALMGLLLVAQARRWFARFPNGVFISAAATILTVSLTSAAIIGVWGYGAATRIMRAEMTVFLDSIASIIEQQIELEVRRGTERLAGLTAAVAPALRPGGDLRDLTTSLQAIERFNPHYLEFDVLDADGRLVITSRTGPGGATPDRIATAFNLEGKTFVSEPRVSEAYKRQVVYIGVPVRDAGRVTGVLGAVFDIQAVFEEVIQSATFNQSGYAVIVGSDGRVLAHPDPKRVGEDVSRYPAVVEGMRTRSGELAAPNAAGLVRRFMFRQVRNPQTVDPKPWVLLTEIDESEALRPLEQLRDELAAGVLVIVALGLAVAWNAARNLGRPLQSLEDVAHAVEGGDLTRTSKISGRDAFARLGGAIDSMVKGLEERDRVKDVFGRYIAKQAAEHLLKGPLHLGGETKRVTILFSDIRGFTAMSESMTPEQVVGFLNEYFSEMVEAVMEQAGMLDKYLGDGLMAVFGSFGDQPDHARRAVLAALRMKALLAKINGERAMAGKAPIEIGIGIHTDEVIVGNIGSRKRLEYTHIGDGVNTASRLQALSKEHGATIVVSGQTMEALGGTFTARRLPDATLRGKTKSLAVYEVTSAAAAV